MVDACGCHDDIKAALMARERACTLELRTGHAYLLLGAAATWAFRHGPLATQVSMSALFVALAIAVTGALQLLNRNRVVLMLTGYPGVYAGYEAKGLTKGYERFDHGRGLLDVWDGRMRVSGCLCLAGLLFLWGALPLAGTATESVRSLSLGALPIALAFTQWTNLAVWRLYLRHEVARVARVDSFRLMEQEGYCWTWWGGWRGGAGAKTGAR